MEIIRQVKPKELAKLMISYLGDRWEGWVRVDGHLVWVRVTNHGVRTAAGNMLDADLVSVHIEGDEYEIALGNFRILPLPPKKKK